jgi:hypothetical protein
MIVYWKKSIKKDKINEKKNYENIFDKTSFEITNESQLNNNKDMIYDSIVDSKNCSFISQNSNSLLNIFQNETNESSLIDSQSSNKSINKKNNSFDFIKKNFENLSIKEKEIFIINEFDKKIKNNYISNNSTASFLTLMKLCNDKEYLLNIIYNCVMGNFLKIVLNKYNCIFLKEIYDYFNDFQISQFIKEIIKNLNYLINNENGYQVILFFIIKKRLDLINPIIFASLQFFIQYSINKYSSEIICTLYTLGNDFINHQLNIKLINNIKYIIQNKNGFKVLTFAKQFSNIDDNLYIEQVLKSFY